jgi:hypothetical protein
VRHGRIVHMNERDSRGDDRMVVSFISTYAISVTNVVSSIMTMCTRYNLLSFMCTIRPWRTYLLTRTSTPYVVVLFCWTVWDIIGGYIFSLILVELLTSFYSIISRRTDNSISEIYRIPVYMEQTYRQLDFWTVNKIFVCYFMARFAFWF